MEKLLKLINEYEESRWTTIDDWLTEEERESWAIIEEKPMWSEYEWHLRHCNANKVAYEKDTFDAYALSKKYWFIAWLVRKHKTERLWIDLFIRDLAIADNPIQELIDTLV